MRIPGWLLLFTIPAYAAGPASVESFSPQGTVKQVRQVTARFAAPMVALGDPQLPDPFAIDCAAPGKGRWADTRNWVYDFDADLRAGLRCRFTLKQETLGQRTFAFDTGGPAVQASMPREGWEDLDEEQIFLLRLDAPAMEESVREHAHCVIEGISERVPLEVFTGERRKAVLAQRRSLGYSYYEILWKSGDVSNARVRNRSLETAEELIAVVQCKRRLPNATQVQLVWDAGIATASGIATTQAQKLAFKVRPAFTVRVECTRTEPNAGCMPIQPVVVRFSAPVPRERALAILLRGKDGMERKPESPEAKQAPRVEAVTFKPPFPEGMALTVLMPPSIVDDAGRPLENAARFPLELRIDDYPPLVKFSREFGILEAREGGVLPITMRNVEADSMGPQVALPGKRLRVASDPAAIAQWIARVRKAMERSGEYRERWLETTGSKSVFEARDAPSLFALAKPTGAKPAEVAGIPLGAPGFYVVEVESRKLGASLLGENATRYVATSALVTNLAVHLKWGREGSRVWVTRLDNGAPVPDAQVTLLNFCSGAPYWRGKTDRSGIAAISGKEAEALGAPHENDSCESWSPPPLMATAQVGEDLSFALSSWTKGIAPHEFGLSVGGPWNARIYHTVLDRPLFRAGETVSMKHFLRRHRSEGLAAPDGAAGKRKVIVSHLGSNQRYVLQATFGADGIAEQTWTIPAEAKLGDYSLAIEDGKDDEVQSGQFKVEEFRLPTMRAAIQGPARPLVRPRDVTLDLQVSYLSGGGASGMPVKVRSMVELRPVRYPGYEDFNFSGAPVQEGLDTESGSGADFDFEGDSARQTDKAQVLPLTLDAQGTARVTIPDLPAVEAPMQLTAELEYPDANGELLTATTRVRLTPAALSVGIRSDSWVASAEQMRFRVLALGLDGQPLIKQKVVASLYRSTAYSYRKRLIGGFYTYETAREIKKLPQACEGVTNAQGLLLCELAPGISGEVLVRAEAQDASGQRAGATTSIWLAGKDEWWFGGTTADRMDLLPEKKEYEAGQVARLQVRMPFRSATALVTVEREGVLSSFVTKLSGRTPVVEVPIADTYAPNVYVSVLAVRGRIGGKRFLRSSADGKEITALVDLNKPAYRLGNAELRVGWKPHRLDVRVTPERTVYRVRDKAKIHIEVVRANGAPLPADAEIALAAVDEALLELAPNRSWALLDAMMGQRGLEVWTSTAQMQVVGKRHYGRKAVPHGGGGGRERARESFDNLLLWKGRVRLDEHGKADAVIPLNDSLSSFRIVAIAHAGSQLFGTGEASIAATQDLILLSGLPPLLREGDRYAATFTVRNTGAQAMAVDVTAKVTPASAESLADQRIDIPPGEARDVIWNVTAPVGTSRLLWEVSAKQMQGDARDSVKIVETVIPAYPVRTYQATIAQLAKPLTMPVERPKQALPGRGGLEVALRARLGNGLDGVREYMDRYPYICLEQNVSRAVALRNRAAWDSWMARLPAYMDRDGLLKYFPAESLQGEDALTSYVLAIGQEAGWEIPAAPRQQLIQALTNFVQGRIVRDSALPTADLTVRKLAAIDALARHGAAKPGMLDSVTIEPNLWPTSGVLDWLGILRRVRGIPDAVANQKAAEGILRARLNFQGTTMGFSTERSDALWWLMVSQDSNAVRLLSEMLDKPQWREDVPRLVRGALGRQQAGHWNTTVANAWGVLAMEKFSAAFESTPVAGKTSMHYDKMDQSIAWPQPSGAGAVELPWQEGRKTLTVTHQGAGRPWVTVRATAALPLDKPLSTGFKIQREVTAVEQKQPGKWTRGDVARIRLELEAQSDMTWVVVEDPVPAGATVLGSGLNTQSQLLTGGERREGWAWPAFEERKFEAFRAYYRYVPKGQWVLEYTVRLNNPGTFLLPATRVEAMYAPEMLGEIPNAPLAIEAAP